MSEPDRTQLPDSEQAQDLGGLNRLLRMAAVLVVDDEPGMLNFIQRALHQRCALLEVASSAEQAEALRLRVHFDVLLVDIRLPGLSGLEWLGGLRQRGVRTHVIYMTAYADLDMAVSALRHGADDFLMKPFRMEQMLLSLKRTLQRSQILRENSLLKLQLRRVQQDEGFIAQSPVMQELLTLMQQLAATDSPVLIDGETGTGKTRVARTLHRLSGRSGAFIEFDCASLEAEQAEDLLFDDHDALFPCADGGTLLLANIESLPPLAQARLIQFIDRGTLHSPATVPHQPLNVRLLASTAATLDGSDGRLRRDLHYRLCGLSLTVPPLRERQADIQPLAESFLQRLSVRLHQPPVELLHMHWQQLCEYRWPGNVRELHNVMERIILLGQFHEDSLHGAVDGAETQAGTSGPGYPKDWPLEAVERAHIESVLASVKENKSAAARVLGVSRKTLERKQALWQQRP